MTLNIDGFGDEVVYVSSLIAIAAIISFVYILMNRHLLSDVEGRITQIFGHLYHSQMTSTLSTDHDEEEYATHNNADSMDRTVYDANNCPICLNPFRYCTLANCGHIYCNQCIISYWRHGTWLRVVACPVCRTDVTVLIPNFSEADVDDPERSRAAAEIRTYNRRFSNHPRSFVDYIRDVPVLLPNLFSHLFTLRGLMFMFRLRILLLFAGGLYILSPFDILPEAFLGVFGLLDDLFVAFVLSCHLCVVYRQFLQT